MAEGPENAPLSPPEEGAEAAPSAPKPSRVGSKVELDLDDAPFLQEEEPEPQPKPQAAAAPERPVRDVPAPKGSSLQQSLAANKKKLILAGVAAVVLLAAGIGVNIFLSGPKTPPPVQPEPEKVLAAPKPLPEAPVPQFVMQWEPFWVELKDTEGGIRFLTCTLTIPTNNPVLYAEMAGKRLVLRDALFYYLRNQPILSLTDESKVNALKSDLLTVVNEHLGSGKASELLIQEYLVR